MTGENALTAANTLEPGCIICAGTIPEKKAKFRSLTCSDACAKTRRNARLTPAKYRDLALYCQVCRGIIPPITAKKGGVVCSANCRNELRRYRWTILKTQKCPHCYHPSSPAEWERYRQWRASEGPMQGFVKEANGRGNLAWKREKELRDALKAAVLLLKDELAVILDSYCVERMEGQPVRDSLSADGERFAVPLEQCIAQAEALLPKPKQRARRTKRKIYTKALK